MRRTFPAPRVLWLALSVLALAVVPGVAHAVVQQITTNISANTSWGLPASGSTVEADVFWVRNSITINSGVTLTIKQGVVVKFDPGVYLSAAGALQCQGTVGSNIILTSIRDDAVGGDTGGDGATTPNASDWQSVYVTAATPDTSRFIYTQVRYAGSGNHGGVTVTNVSARVTSCTFTRCYTGIDIAGTATPIIQDSNVQQSTLTPVILDATANPTFLNFAFSSGNNTYDAFGVRGGSISGTSTLPKRAATVGATLFPNVTYVLLGSLTVNAASTLNLAAGIALKMTSGAYITANGALNLNGTLTDTVSVTSILDDNIGFPKDTNNNGSSTSAGRNDWNGLYWNAGSSGVVTYSRIRFGTNSVYYGMLDLTNVNVPVSNTTLSDAGHGIVIRGTSAPVLTNVTINNSLSTPTMQSVTASPTFTNLSFSANGLTALGLLGEAITTAAHITQRNVAGFTNITYVMLYSQLTINNPGTLLIDPGVVIKFVASTGIYNSNVLDAQGTAVTAPIVFTSWKDDAYGNPADTNGDFSATSPAAGDWYGINLDDTSVDASCKITNDRIAYTGAYPYYAAITCTRSSPTLTGNTITRSTYGVQLNGPSNPNFSNNTVSYCTSEPIVMSAMADPTLTGNTFTNCGVNGIGLISETLTQSATIKYRPTVTYPAPNQTTVFAYVPLNTITVPAGLTLTIQPQVVIKPVIGGGTWFDIFGTLNAVGGTGANRIVFTSLKDDSYAGDTNADLGATAPAAGNWGSIYFEDTSVDAACVMRNVLLQFGSVAATGAITTINASPKLAALDFYQNGTGLTLSGTSASACDSINITNSTYLPMVLSLASNPTFAHMTFANNAWTAIGLLGETVTQSCTLSPRVFGTGILNPMVYIPTGTITIGAGTTCTISGGTIIKLGRPYSEQFGNLIQVNGALNAAGTVGSPIFFTSTADDQIGGDTHGDGLLTTPAIDNYTGLVWSSGSNAAASGLAYCRFRYGGYSGGPVVELQSSNVPISNSTFFTCSNGIAIEGNSAPVLTNVQVDTCTVPIRLSLVSNPTFTNVNFVGNTYTALGVVTETLAQDALWKLRPISGRLNMPYLVDGALGVGPGATLTMQPGVIVKLAAGSIDITKAFFSIGRTIPESLVVFTSYRDDSYGGKTWLNPSNTSPTAGDWNYITIEGTSIDASVVFRDCVVRYGSNSSTQGAIRCVNSSPTIDSTIVAYNGCGVSVEGASNPLIRGSSLYGNSYYAVNNVGGAFCVAATGDFWGAANGPSDANAAADLCGSASNAGSGDIVSQNVNYTGFATVGVNPLLGDVSLNGQVRAFDASLVLQYLAATFAPSPLQKLVANVDNSLAIDNADASLILQFVAGVIPALPGNATRLHPLTPAEAAIVDAAVHRAEGRFTLTTGAARRVGDTWELPILVEGSGGLFGAEVALSGASAAMLAGAQAADGAMEAHGVAEGVAHLALASASALTPGEIATLVFPATGADWVAPEVSFARVNRDIVTPDDASPSAPAHAFFALPWPNPTAGAATLRLGISADQAGARAQVSVFDLSGRRVRTVWDGALAAGIHTLRWDLLDSAGHPAAPGVYLVRAESGRFRSVQRLVVVR